MTASPRARPSQPHRALAHLRECLAWYGLTLRITLNADGTGFVELAGYEWAITEELERLVTRYEADLITEALADPLVAYALYRLTRPPE
jgi:hypothetical protein